MKKGWQVFRLDKAVSGISNDGITYDEYTFTLAKSSDKVFDSVQEGEMYIENILKDNKERGVIQDNSYTILPIYCNENHS